MMNGAHFAGQRAHQLLGDISSHWRAALVACATPVRCVVIAWWPALSVSFRLAAFSPNP